MVGAFPVVGSSRTIDSRPACSCFCVEAISSSCVKNGFNMSRNWTGWKLGLYGGRGGVRDGAVSRSSWRKPKQGRGLVVVSELAGQYEDSFEDVKGQIFNYFTYKAVRTVLNQLYEMNPVQYRWFYEYVATNNSADGRRFIRNLGKAKHELAERVMITRLHLYGKWVKKCNHAEMYQAISDENLELMRERLMETIIWPTDDTNTMKKIG